MIATLMFGLAASAPRLAIADEVSKGEDTVVLKNGGMVRGTVVSVEPDKEVVILVMGTGKERTIPWDEVERVNIDGVPQSKSGGKSTTAKPPRSKAKPPRSEEQDDSAEEASEDKSQDNSADESAEETSEDESDEETSSDEPETPGLVRLHIKTNNPRVQLHRYQGAAVTAMSTNAIAVTQFSKVLCRAPCDILVDGRKGERFFFGGEGIRQSSTFDFIDKSGDLTAKVSPGSASLWIGGYIVGSLGLGMIGGGAVLVWAGSGTTLEFDPVNNDLVEVPKPSGMKIAGGVMIGAGAAAVIGGILMLVNGTTTYEFKKTTNTGMLRLTFGTPGRPNLALQF